MKILLFTDLHMCPRASIVNKWGTKYPSRLENCIASLNWIERQAEELDCDIVINLGDFFDKPDLTSETITACNDIEWSGLLHYSIVGNHDASNSSLTFSSVNSLLEKNHKIISEPQIHTLYDCDLCFLPYITECDRKDLEEYFGKRVANRPRIILSHNDISGLQLGPVVSKTGFGIEEIEANCDLFLNGHLHNGQAITQKVINLGNLTGKDFGEDAFRHSHCAAVLDTSNMSLTYIENPYAYNFYKIDISTEIDIVQLHRLKNNAVISVKCEQSLIEKVKQQITELPNIIESRIIVTKQQIDSIETAELDLTLDHLSKFIECCRATIENSTLLEEELSEICK